MTNDTTTPTTGKAATKRGGNPKAGAAVNRLSRPQRTAGTTTKVDDDGPSGEALLEGIKRAEKEAVITELPRLKVAKIAPHPDNPKIRSEATPATRDLANSIETQGLIGPITVTSRQRLAEDAPEVEQRLPEWAEWVVIAGHRRLRAHRPDLADVEEIPTLIRTGPVDRVTTMKIFLAENGSREDPDAVTVAEGYEVLRESGLSTTDIAKTVGVSQSHVVKLLKLVKLNDEQKAAVRDNKLPVVHAQALADLASADRQAVWDAWKADPQTKLPVHLTRHKAQQQAAATPQPARAAANKPAARPDTEADEDQDEQIDDSAAPEVTTTKISTTPGRESAGTAPTTDPADEAPAPSGRTTPTRQASTSENDEQDSTAAGTTSASHEQAITVLLQQDLSPTAALDILTDAALFASNQNATEWHSPVATALDLDLPAALAKNIARTTARKAAVGRALWLLHADQAAVDDGADWPPHIARHLHRLVDLGVYTLTSDEAARMPK